MQKQNEHPKDRIDLSASIKGWGADLDPKNRPGVPREKESDLNRHFNAHLDQQVPRFPIFKSIERPELTPVFGTAQPPRGLSGVMRKFAYQFSEQRMSRWMTLLMADRVDMVEGIIDDLLHLKVPNFYKEMGLSAEMKYNPKFRYGLMAVGGIAALGAAALIVQKRKARA